MKMRGEEDRYVMAFRGPTNRHGLFLLENWRIEIFSECEDD